MKSAWVIMPIIDLLEMTLQAIRDCLDQRLEEGTLTRVLVISNGSTDVTRLALEELQEASAMRVLVWHHDPPLWTLNATWNRALEFCWEAGAEEALVVNNDVRLHPTTYAALSDVLFRRHALFVSAVGVTEDQFFGQNPAAAPPIEDLLKDRGGPDYSCFLISKACHRRFPFDPAFTYYGDNDHHYRLKLAGEGGRIFGVNVPYLHYGSKTINRSPEAAAKYAKVFDAHQALYLKKWGGLGGREEFLTPYNQNVLDQVGRGEEEE